MKIMVAVKQVAALDEDFTIRADGRDVDADFLIRDLNEWDDFSLEEAVKIKEAAGEAGPVEVVAVSVGPEEVDESLRKCLAKGRGPRDSRMGCRRSKDPTPSPSRASWPRSRSARHPRCCSPVCNHPIRHLPPPASPRRRSSVGRTPRW